MLDSIRENEGVVSSCLVVEYLLTMEPERFNGWAPHYVRKRVTDILWKQVQQGLLEKRKDVRSAATWHLIEPQDADN